MSLVIGVHSLRRIEVGTPSEGYRIAMTSFNDAAGVNSGGVLPWCPCHILEDLLWRGECLNHAMQHKRGCQWYHDICIDAHSARSLLTQHLHTAGDALPERQGSLQATQGHQVQPAPCLRYLRLSNAPPAYLSADTASDSSKASLFKATSDPCDAQGWHPNLLPSVRGLWAPFTARLLPQLRVPACRWRQHLRHALHAHH